MTAAFIEDAGLLACGARHGFGVRGAAPPAGVRRVHQVHGDAVVLAAGPEPVAQPDADALVACAPGPPVAVITADCVPVLLAAQDARAVAAIHAGWRGLACGVIPAALERLAAQDVELAAVRAAVGPHIGPCCYEVDGPVLGGLEPRFGSALSAAGRPGRAGHWWLDLAALAVHALIAAGVGAQAIRVVPDACTHCDAARFHSYRRDGDRSGRLLHWIAPAGNGLRQA